MLFSNVFVDYGNPIKLDQKWLAKFRQSERETITELTKIAKEKISELTTTAPNTTVMKVSHLATQMYQKTISYGKVRLDREYISTTKKFVQAFGVTEFQDEEIKKLFSDLVLFQSHLDLLGLT